MSDLRAEQSQDGNGKRKTHQRAASGHVQPSLFKVHPKSPPEQWPR
jgi:hypothetical protein